VKVRIAEIEENPFEDLATVMERLKEHRGLTKYLIELRIIEARNERIKRLTGMRKEQLMVGGLLVGK